MQGPLFPVRQVGATKIWVFPPSFKDLSTLELLETASKKWRLWNVKNGKMPRGHMFATKKYLDLDLNQFWTILCRFWMVPLKSTEYWWLSSLWGTSNVPMIFFQGSHNHNAPVEMTWFSTQENAKKPVPSPRYQTFSLSSYCPGLCEAFKWEAWVFLSCAAKVCKGYDLMKKSRTPSNSWFMMHISKPKSQVYTSFLILLHVFSLHFLNLPASTRWTRKLSFQTSSRCRF